MSVTVMGRIFWTEIVSLPDGKDGMVSGAVAKLVLLAIGDVADDYGENSWQSFETVAIKASIQRRSAIRAIRALVQNGYLKLAGTSPYGTNDYAIMLEKLGKPPEKRMKNGRPKTSDGESLPFIFDEETSDGESPAGDSSAKTSDSHAETSDSTSPDSSFKHPLNMSDKAQKAWEQVQEQLQWEMPKASYDTWVKSTQAVSYENGIFVVATENVYGRDWLRDRLTLTAMRYLRGILNEDLELEFVRFSEIVQSQEVTL